MPPARAESRAQPPAEAGIQVPIFLYCFCHISGQRRFDDRRCCRSGFERLLRVLRQREEVRVATSRNQVHILQRVNSDCRWSDATIGNRAIAIRRVFPNSLLVSEISPIARHNSVAFREEGNCEARRARVLIDNNSIRAAIAGRDHFRVYVMTN
jgi:hypothetical protein